MDGLGTRAFRRLDDALDDQITLSWRRRANQHRFVGETHVARSGVGLRKDGDRAHAQAPRGLNDTTSNFAAIRNKNFFEHG
jgi:hypothetical protein